MPGKYIERGITAGGYWDEEGVLEGVTPMESVEVEVRERVEVEEALRVAVVVADGRGEALGASEKVREGVALAEAEAPLLLLALAHGVEEGVAVSVPAPPRLGEALVEGERELEAVGVSPLPWEPVTVAVALGVGPGVPLARVVRVAALVAEVVEFRLSVLPEVADAVAAPLLLPPCPALGEAPGEGVLAGEPLPCVVAEGVRVAAGDAVRGGEGEAVPLPAPPLLPVGGKVGGGGTVPGAEAVAGV